MAESTEANLEVLARTWHNPASFPHALAEVNNQPIGKRFMLTAFIFFLLGGVLALLMRIQLAVADNDFLGPQVYNQLFTMHGSTMMYLFAVPFLEGLALYLLPLMLGSRDVAFPRLTAFSYWMFLFGGLIFYASFITGTVPDAGWFAYTPLSGPEYAGIQQDFWLIGLAMVEVAGIATAAEIVVTILKLRAPGMTLARMPLFVWAMLVVGIMIIFAFTTLLMATVLLELDRAVGTHFFNPDLGGNSLLWQHLFWFFGHPEVYIMFLPATGIVSMVAATFARRLVGYTPIIVAIVVTGFVSFGLWVHHMYTTGLPHLSMHFFAAASLMIATASGVQVFAWIATLWGTRPALKTPLLYVLGFLFLFVLGGFTGVMVAIVPFDWQVHDTFFLVAHFHYVLIGGVVFPVFAGLHYYLPKITGRLLDERLGVLSFWLAFLGFNATFFPMHIMGLFGLPRRVYTYPMELGLDSYNLLASVGAFVFAGGVLLFLVNLAVSLRRGAAAGPDPWGADTLEWSVDSPPKSYSFVGPPLVRSRHPMWTDPAGPTEGDPALPGSTQSQARTKRAVRAMHGQPEHWRGTLVTDTLHALPQAIQWLPGPTYVPLFSALGLLAAALGTLYKVYLLAPLGVLFTLVMVAVWLWPQPWRLAMLRSSEATLGEAAGLPIFTTGSSSPGWWGMVSLLAVLATAFAVLVYAYFYLWLFSSEWPQQDLPLPDLLLPGGALAVLVASSGLKWWARRLFLQRRHRPLQLVLMGTFALGLLFVGWQVYELATLPFGPRTNAYGSIFHVTHYTLTAMVLTAMALNVTVQVRLRHHDDVHGYMPLQIQLAGMLWHFAVAVGVLTFLMLYVAPYLI